MKIKNNGSLSFSFEDIDKEGEDFVLFDSKKFLEDINWYQKYLDFTDSEKESLNKGIITVMYEKLEKQKAAYYIAERAVSHDKVLLESVKNQFGSISDLLKDKNSNLEIYASRDEDNYTELHVFIENGDLCSDVKANLEKGESMSLKRAITSYETGNGWERRMQTERRRETQYYGK